MWTSAQAPLYLFAGAPVYIYRDLGGVDHWVWFITANLLATAAISPFVGALSDLMGRRYVAVMGSVTIILGQVICGAARDMDMFIAGMTITGVGTGINELTALAGTAELVPLSRRGYYIAGMVLTILPFLPSAMFAQLISFHASWRYIAVVTSVWAFLGLVATVGFYSPPPRVRDLQGWREKVGLLKRTDVVGGVLSIVGLAGLEAGILGGGYQYPWTSAHTLVPLVLGVVVIGLFVAWERCGANNPMVPRGLSKAPRTLALTMIITFISGANFFSVLLLWPPEAYNVYGHDPVGVGIRGMPFAFGVFGGCVLSLVLLSWFRGQIKWLIFSASVLMTVGCGCLSLATVDNIQTVYGILFVAGVGVGGITIPVSTVATIICAGDVIATVTALTIAVRIVGGAVGYAIYFNVFVQKLIPELTALVGGACVRNGITDPRVIGEVIQLTAVSLINEIRDLPGIDEGIWADIVASGQRAYANAYPWAYYCSVAFGAVSVLASLFLGDISEMVDDSVVAVI
ncbi:major facilitator superfamily domain-containing protein [Chaetomidium leptoderma]|uniref:Major facilitator superfamily domain-containing protein n=1 Tax=Chaetomidium leptoderma TaxID=669021 RepID=A0AAN6VP08_9PEZI|nr:major facilitator superfamily domain-containing protein [Chaetomidium leptoderma]